MTEFTYDKAMTLLGEYGAAESKRNAEAAQALHARNTELDRLNGDLHDQIRDRDATIFKLRQEIETRMGMMASQRQQIRKLSQSLEDAAPPEPAPSAEARVRARAQVPEQLRRLNAVSVQDRIWPKDLASSAVNFVRSLIAQDAQAGEAGPIHASHCSLHNGPAEVPQPCNCGADPGMTPECYGSEFPSHHPMEALRRIRARTQVPEELRQWWEAEEARHKAVEAYNTKLQRHKAEGVFPPLVQDEFAKITECEKAANQAERALFEARLIFAQDAQAGEAGTSLRMLVDADWLRRGIDADPDLDCEAGTPEPAREAEALRKLVAEIEALRAFEEELWAVVGNTNWDSLIHRLAEAYAALGGTP